MSRDILHDNQKKYTDAERMKIIMSSISPKLSYPGMAEMLGLKRQDIADVAAGRKKFQHHMAVAIEEKLHYSFKWIMTGQGPMILPEPSGTVVAVGTGRTPGDYKQLSDVSFIGPVKQPVDKLLAKARYVLEVAPDQQYFRLVVAIEDTFRQVIDLEEGRGTEPQEGQEDLPA
jgi:hypothetical protein